MKGFGFWVLMLMSLAAVLVCFGFFMEEDNITSSDAGLIQEHDGSYATMAMKGRKLKEEVYSINGHRDGRDHHHDELEDYRPIDPVPSSMASIRPGPIQHGTPLMPYIPQPSPPPDGGYPEQPSFP